MVVLNYKDNRNIKKDVKALFLSAFPKDERPPAYYFFSSALKETNNIYAFYEKEAFIGFIQLTTFKDICYVFFLAVKKELRCQGWGSKILSWIKEFQKDKVILLCYEEVDEKYKDNEARIKRRDFYIKKMVSRAIILKPTNLGQYLKHVSMEITSFHLRIMLRYLSSDSANTQENILKERINLQIRSFSFVIS